MPGLQLTGQEGTSELCHFVTVSAAHVPRLPCPFFPGAWRCQAGCRGSGGERPGYFWGWAWGCGQDSGFRGGQSREAGSGTEGCRPRPPAVPCSSRGCSRRSRSSDTGTSRLPSAWTSCGTSHASAWSTGARTHRAWRRRAASSSSGSPSCAGGHGWLGRGAGGRASLS